LRNLIRAGGLAAFVAAVLLATPLVASANPSELYANDGCSPSFNVAIGPGTCASPGGTPFNIFIQELTQNGFDGAWHFSANQVNVSPGSELGVGNRGGEFHTFSEVQHFGGGCIAILDRILGLQPVPECANFPAGAGINPLPAGLDGGDNPIPQNELSPGVHLFQCLIHPWMRVVVTVG
jgi:hypothetical protein